VDYKVSRARAPEPPAGQHPRAPRASTSEAAGPRLPACYNPAPKVKTPMLRRKFLVLLAAVFCASLALSAAGAAQKNKKDKEVPTTGAVRGRVKVAQGASPSGVEVTVHQGEEEIARATTDAKGDFEVRDLRPGTYRLTFRKTGLQVGRLIDVEVVAGRTASYKEKLYLGVDEGSIAHLRGSVFTAAGLSVPGAKVEVARVLADGSVKKLDSRVTNSTGSFAFRLSPEAAHYRVTVKAGDAEPVTEDVHIDGAQIYRVALSLKPAAK